MGCVQQLLDDLKKAEMEYKEAKDKVEFKKNSLYADADFKALGYTNSEQRKAYVDMQVHKKMEDVKLGKKEIEYNHLKRVYEMALAEARSTNNFYGNITNEIDGKTLNAVRAEHGIDPIGEK